MKKILLTLVQSSLISCLFVSPVAGLFVPLATPLWGLIVGGCAVALTVAIFWREARTPFDQPLPRSVRAADGFAGARILVLAGRGVQRPRENENLPLAA